MEAPRGGREVGRICYWLGMKSFPPYLIHVPVWQRRRGTTGRVGRRSHGSSYLRDRVAGIVATFLNEEIVRALPARLVRRNPSRRSDS